LNGIKVVSRRSRRTNTPRRARVRQPEHGRNRGLVKTVAGRNRRANEAVPRDAIG
jgi:hypothetical protein